GVGQVFADEGPVEFTAGVTARGTETCTFEVVQPDTNTATATYTKGAGGALGSMAISGEPMEISVKAVGGTSCLIRKVDVKATYNASKIAGDGGVYGVLTSSGSGYVPVNWALGLVKGLDAAQVEQAGTVSWGNGQGTRKSRRTPLQAGDQKVSGSEYLRFAQAAGGLRIAHIHSGVVIGDKDNPATLVNPFSHDYNFRDQGVSFSSEAGIKTVVLGVVPMVGATPYNATTHLSDDSVVTDEESLQATATLTITAS
uniref:hypothetical protein n=1 Tax=Pseudomonas canadensis TaxID=915099 RepID=UPI003B9DDA97